MDNSIIDFESARSHLPKPKRAFDLASSTALSSGNIIDLAGDPLSLIKNINLAGIDGAKNWRSVIRLAERAGFSETDFRGRLNASKNMVRFWSRGMDPPPENKRFEFQRVITGVLEARITGHHPVSP
ncbi:MAG: hypothetical protein DI586_10795 [Micavibrio aeruginosavorus]|uniref:Uncharacterized protein n=1 Tax=Micavibrio aeruginosavorus TaxID=349221 RepID=A0A2W5FIX0_9BACT|nr:MAG: hypothetical protein DI586_10795 [Micavibrio aeruginosavorus]